MSGVEIKSRNFKKDGVGPNSITRHFLNGMYNQLPYAFLRGGWQPVFRKFDFEHIVFQDYRQFFMRAVYRFFYCFNLFDEIGRGGCSRRRDGEAERIGHYRLFEGDQLLKFFKLWIQNNEASKQPVVIAVE